MQAEIERILATDEAARDAVQAAGVEAERIRSDARQQSAAIEAAMQQERAGAIQGECESIVAQARSKAQDARDAANSYLKGLQNRREAVLDELLEALLRKVTGA